jgi:hypothetical protein
MTIHLRAAFGTTACLFFLTTLALGQSKPSKRVPVLVAVEKQTASYYEKAFAKPIATIVRAQMDTVNSQFRASGQFKNLYDFRADSVYVVEGIFQTDLVKPHPGFDYKIAIDGFAASTSPGGWYAANQLIYHKWMRDSLGGPFGRTATEALTRQLLAAVPASIQLTEANKTLYCTGDSLVAHATSDGPFGLTNAFSLQLSDSTGSFRQPTTLQTGAAGALLVMLKGMIPTLLSGNYKVRIASSQPVIYSNELTFKVQSSPTVPVVSTLLACQNASAPVLTASGQNLRWYSAVTGGIGSSIPPVVSTARAGDTTFYVSQSTLGCESPRAPLRVTVRALPTLSVEGSASIYQGESAQLTLRFTGTGPFQYRLSTGLSGSANRDTVLRVQPSVTTTYTVEEVRNICGIGTPQSPASAQVTVLAPSVQTLAPTPAALCPGGNFKVNYQVSGRLLPGTTIRLQLAKETAGAYKDIPLIGAANGEVTAKLPDTLTAGSYRLRVVAGNPAYEINGSASATKLTVLSAPTAILTGGEQIFGRDTARLSVSFTGQGPWTFTYRSVYDNSIGTEFSVTTAANPHQFRVSPLITSAYYLTSVRNACGSGTFSSEKIMIKVVPLLSTADPVTESRVEVFPVPTRSTLTLRIREFASQKAVHWELYNLLGQVVMHQGVREEESALSLETQPAGLYLLRIRIGDQTVLRRIVKQ